MDLDELRELFRDACEEYADDDTVFSEEPPRVRVLKSIINKRLDPVDRNILLAYVKLESYRELGAYLDVSHSSARKIVLDIKRKVIEMFNEVDKK